MGVGAAKLQLLGTQSWLPALITSAFAICGLAASKLSRAMSQLAAMLVSVSPDLMLYKPKNDPLQELPAEHQNIVTSVLSLVKGKGHVGKASQFCLRGGKSNVRLYHRLLHQFCLIGNQCDLKSQSDQPMTATHPL